MTSRAAGIGAVLVLLAGGVLGVRAAETARTGRNGLIVFASDRASPTAPIYSVTSTGRGRRRLEPSEQDTRQPLPSPNGSRIAYTVDGLIVTARLDGRGRRRVGVGEDPSWAPDSLRLAFSRLVEENPDGWWPHVFVADALTGRVRDLARGSHPSWSPDGRRLAVSQYVDDGGPFVTIVRAADGSIVRRLDVVGEATWARRGGRIAVAEDGIVIVDESGRRLGRVDSLHPTNPDPAWSPDGRLLAFVDSGRGRVLVVRFDGGRRRVLARKRSGPVALDWSPDGRSVAFASSSAVYAVRFDGKGLRRVARAPRGGRIASAPRWTRDNRIVYAAWSPSTLTRGDLYTMRSDGSAVRRLTRSKLDEGAPVWSPDGAMILFTRGSRLFVHDVLGGRPRMFPVRGMKYQYAPSWSPDGSRVVFVGARAAYETDGIYTVSSLGGTARGILDSDAVYDPRWSPDGSLIAFGMQGQLMVMRPDGSQLRKVADPPLEPDPCFSLLDTVAWAPDGRLAFVSHGECRGNYTPYDQTVHIVRLDGSTERTMQAHSSGRLVWSPDEQWLLQSGGSDPSLGKEYALENLDILRMRSDGTQRVSLTRGVAGTDGDWQPLCDRRGSARGDRLEGAAADELLCGLAGNDTVTGGAGSDRLFGEEGDDRVFAGDGEFDVVGCGPGRDTVEADRTDLVGRDCERVVRR